MGVSSQQAHQTDSKCPVRTNRPLFLAIKSRSKVFNAIGTLRHVQAGAHVSMVMGQVSPATGSPRQYMPYQLARSPNGNQSSGGRKISPGPLGGPSNRGRPESGSPGGRFSTFRMRSSNNKVANSRVQAVSKVANSDPRAQCDHAQRALPDSKFSTSDRGEDCQCPCSFCV